MELQCWMLRVGKDRSGSNVGEDTGRRERGKRGRVGVVALGWMS